MVKRYLPIIILLSCLLVITVDSYVKKQPEPTEPVRILLKNSAGKVVFEHKKHIGYNIECQTCHHESSKNNIDPITCANCHGQEFNESFKATHQDIFSSDLAACATCHHLEFKSKNWEHDVHICEYVSDCQTCHHSTDVEPEPMNCVQCHDANHSQAMPSLRAAVHVKCESCHADLFDKKLSGCVFCHEPINMRSQVEMFLGKQESQNKNIVIDVQDKSAILNATLIETEKDEQKIFGNNTDSNKKIDELFLIEGAKTSAKVQAKNIFAEKFMNCNVCHYEKNVNELMLNNTTAFHLSCMGCHEKENKGPYQVDQCKQCHHPI